MSKFKARLISEKDKKKETTTKPTEETQVRYEEKVKHRWTIITPNGNEYLVHKPENKRELINFHRSIQARDSQSGEVGLICATFQSRNEINSYNLKVMITREDNLKIVHRTDGSSLVEFDDGTRITTFYAHTDPELPDDSIREKYVKVECPGFASTIFNSKTSECTLAFATGTLVACDPAKCLYNVVYNNSELVEIGPDGLVSYMPK